MGGWKMKSMVIRTRERHVKGQEWGRKEKQQPPVLCKENTQKAWGGHAAPSPLVHPFPGLAPALSGEEAACPGRAQRRKSTAVDCL